MLVAKNSHRDWRGYEGENKQNQENEEKKVFKVVGLHFRCVIKSWCIFPSTFQCIFNVDT